MNHTCPIFTLLLAVAMASAPLPLLAQPAQLVPQQERISDEAIQADQKVYETLQARIKGLNDRGRPVRDYHLSKAQCWLDVSFHEYTRNDRGPFPQAAMTESEKLIQGMEAGSAMLPMDTPLVGEAVKLRPDLWERADALKKHAGFRCAQQKVACAEVELVHAGNEHAQQQWRHAKPYVQIAEDLVGEARSLAASCEPPPATVPAAAPQALPLPAPILVQEVSLVAQVVFNFDKFAASDIRPYSVVQVEDLVRRVKAENLEVLAVRLTGHADRLNGTGNADYNKRLSERRVKTVQEVIVKLGVDSKLISADAKGDTLQIQGCEARFKSKPDLEECLLPNRRVEVLFTARRRN